MNVAIISASWLFLVLCIHTPTQQELAQKMKDDAEMAELMQYLKDNEEEINRYMVELIYSKHDEQKPLRDYVSRTEDKGQ